MRLYWNQGNDLGQLRIWTAGHGLGSLGHCVHVDSMQSAVRRIIEEALAGGKRVGVAVSGGADSVYLLRSLVEAFDGQSLVAFHFNHRLRGEASDGDEAFVVALCARLAIPCEVGRAGDDWVEADGASRAPGGTGCPAVPDRGARVLPSEGVLRDQRRAFIHGRMRELGIDLLATGHHADDAAETVLWRLARGSCSRGLAAPRAIQSAAPGITHLRPLLGLGRQAIRAELDRLGQGWREDTSNDATHWTRNRLRLEVLPLLREAVPQAAQGGLERSRRLLEEEDAALEAWLDELDPGREDSLAGDFAFLEGRPQALWRRALEHFLTARGLRPSLEAAAIEDLVEHLRAVQPPRRFSSGVGTFLRVGAGLVEVEEGTKAAAGPGGRSASGCWGVAVGEGPDWSGWLHLPGGGVLIASAQVAQPDTLDAILSGGPDPARMAWLDRDRLEERVGGLLRFRVRYHRPGDRFMPLGAPGSRKLNRWWIDRKVPSAERKKLPIVVAGEGDVEVICWVPGLPPADAFRVTSFSARLLGLTHGNFDQPASIRI